MRRLPSFLFLAALLSAGALLPCAPASAQEGAPLYAGSAREPVRVSVGALGVVYEDGPSQLAVPVSVYAPLARGLGVSVHASYAEALGEGILFVDEGEGPSGFTDAQVSASYFVDLGGAGSVVASLSASAPVGERGWSAEEARAAFLVGQGFYDFPTPVWGQGLNVTPGLTYALPVSTSLAVGVGVAYQRRGAYEPLAGTAAQFDPGAEVLLTAGADAHLGPGTVLALDATYATYGADLYREQTYQASDALAATASLTHTWGRSHLRLLGRVRSRGQSEAAPLPTATDTEVPLALRARAEMRLMLFGPFAIGLAGQARRYDASAAFEAHTLYDVLVRPEIVAGPLSLHALAGGTTGTLRGARAGVGLTWGL